MTELSTDSVPLATRPRRVWPVLAVLTAATFCTVTGEMLPSGLLLALSRDLDVDQAAVGLLVSAWALTIAVVSIPLVRMTLRVPRRLLLTLSLAATAPANLLTALAPNFTVALVGRILAATAHGLFWALVVAYLASVIEPARLGRALSIVLSGPTIAGFVGLPAAVFIAGFVGWRAVFAGLSVLLLLTALAVWMLLPAHTATAGAETGSWDRSARRVVYVAVAGGLVLVGHFAVFTYIATLTIGLGGFVGGALPALLLILGVASGLGVAVSGFASDRWPRAAVGAASALLVIGLALLFLGGGNHVLFAVGIAIWGLAIGAFPPILQARVLRVASPAFRPLAGGVVITALNLGIAGGATLGGAVLGVGQAALVIIAVGVATVGTLALVADRRS